MNSVSVRSAGPADVRKLASLLRQLGHRQDVDSLRVRLEALLSDPRAGAVVASADDDVIGVATYFLVPVIHEDGAWCRITTLVIDELRRRQGVGRQLVAAVEKIAREAGCARLEVTSASHRATAHRLYDGSGFCQTSTHFLKRL
jgi:GNAT superfamily N-acetyltransferase